MTTFRIREAAAPLGVCSDTVAEVVRDAVMAQVEIAAGPFRVVSLMSWAWRWGWWRSP